MRVRTQLASAQHAELSTSVPCGKFHMGNETQSRDQGMTDHAQQMDDLSPRISVYARARTKPCSHCILQGCRARRKIHSSMGIAPPCESLSASPVICPILRNASSRAGTTNGCLHSRDVSFTADSISVRRRRSARSSASWTLRLCCSRLSSSRNAVLGIGASPLRCERRAVCVCAYIRRSMGRRVRICVKG